MECEQLFTRSIVQRTLEFTFNFNLLHKRTKKLNPFELKIQIQSCGSIVIDGRLSFFQFLSNAAHNYSSDKAITLCIMRTERIFNSSGGF